LSTGSVKKYATAYGNTHKDLKLRQKKKFKITISNQTKNPTHKHCIRRTPN
jgi:hypothetical protein